MFTGHPGLKLTLWATFSVLKGYTTATAPAPPQHQHHHGTSTTTARCHHPGTDHHCTVYALIHAELIPKESKSVILTNSGILETVTVILNNSPGLFSCNLPGWTLNSLCFDFSPSYTFLLEFGPRCRCSSRTWGFVHTCKVC